MNNRVTVKVKCYVFVCANCLEIHQSSRSDAITCSPACRVQAHRDGSIKRLLSICEEDRPSAAKAMQALALERLRPDLLPVFFRDGFSDELRQAVLVAHNTRSYEIGSALLRMEAAR